MTALALTVTNCRMSGRPWPVQGSLTITNLVSAAASGVVMLTQPVVQALGPTGVLATDYVGPITIAAQGGALNGTTTTLAVAGVATFVGLSITGSGSVTLVASAPMRASAVSAAITVT